uniref:SWIM zinc finger family protein n=1 Tax=Stenotrophomonas sp. TaxID=69392 RepID=UPI0028AB1308
MNPRSDLLDLTPTALMALANAGFVKRAQKEVAAGLLPALEIDDAGTVIARYDDGCVTRLPVGVTLREADCSCSATAMCRHRVTLVLAWQAQAASAQVSTDAAPAADDYWSPSSFDLHALAQVLPPTVFEQAERLCAAGPLVTVHPWRSAEEPPMAQLPMCSVRFFVRDAIAHARCDCRQGGSCAHLIVAIRAFVLAEQAGALSDARTVQLSPPGAADADPVRQALQADLDALLLSLWLDGAA